MTQPADALTEYVGAASTTPFVVSCWSAAVQMVTDHISDPAGVPAEVPGDVLQLAYQILGADLFHRKSTKNAVAQFAADGAAPVRIARDPMVAVRPLLAPYLPGGFG